MSRSEKLNKLEEKRKAVCDALAAKHLEYDALTAQLDMLTAIAKLDDGAKLRVRIGRGPTSQGVLGTVCGVNRTDPDNLKFKFYYGEGFDASTVIINESQILEVLP